MTASNFMYAKPQSQVLQYESIFYSIKAKTVLYIYMYIYIYIYIYV